MDPLKDKVMVIAWVCHEAIRAYSEAHSDGSNRPWNKLSDAKKQEVVDKVMSYMMNPTATPAQMHQLWVKDMESLGWSHGSLDPVGKKHPSMIPYDLLPWHIQEKDAIFHNIFKALTKGVYSEVPGEVKN
jgi:hypothetical protein